MKKELQKDFRFSSKTHVNYFAHTVGNWIVVSWQDGDVITHMDYPVKTAEENIANGFWVIDEDVEEITTEHAESIIEQETGRKVKIISL